MDKLYNNKINVYIKIIYIFFILIYIFYVYINKFSTKMMTKSDKKYSSQIDVKNFNELLFCPINHNTILLFEPNRCHQECIPGYCKYFIDLGYNVDVLMHNNGINSLSKFEEVEKIRIFNFNNISEINEYSSHLSNIIKKYAFILVQSTNKNEIKLYNKLDLLNINNSIFVFHEIGYSDKIFLKYFKENRIWTLGNISKGLLVNPHYFGNIKLKNKNNKTRFFLTSSRHRNYKHIVEATKQLKNENFNFDIIITGRKKIFNSCSIPRNLSDKFIFKLRCSFSKFYRLVESSDFIIILLDPKNNHDNKFRNSRVTGSFQLSLGFSKPCLINKEFSYFYNLNDKNSIIYNDLDLYKAMKSAILLKNNEYKKLQRNLQITEHHFYSISINNIKKKIKNIKF